MADLDYDLVEKAAKAMCSLYCIHTENHPQRFCRRWVDLARVATEAVADDLRADAWDEGYRHWYDNDVPPEHRSYGTGNPYRQISPKEEQ